MFDKELGKPIVQPVVICCPNKTTDDELLFYLDKEEIDEEICGNGIVLWSWLAIETNVNIRVAPTVTAARQALAAISDHVGLEEVGLTEMII